MIVQGLALVAAAVLWKMSSPRPEIRVADSVVIDPATARAIAAVDHSADFAKALEHFPSDVAGIDDFAFVDDGRTAVVAAVDGQIWKVDLATHATEPFVDVPLMAYGVHEAPGDPNHIYFCASRSYGVSQSEGAVGLYRLALDDRSIEPLVVEVPATEEDPGGPVVYGTTTRRHRNCSPMVWGLVAHLPFATT